MALKANTDTVQWNGQTITSPRNMHAEIDHI